MTVDGKVRWGIVGAGNIARDFLRGSIGSATGDVVAIGTRSPDDGSIAKDFPGVRIIVGLQQLIDDPEVDAVYVATPHSAHAEWAIAACRARRHVLCEKPMGMNAVEAEAIFAAGEENGVFVGEAFMYRHHPLIRAILRLLADDVIGEVRMIRSSFGFALPALPADHRLLNRALGGGAILDVGGYPVSMARLLAGAMTGEGVSDPVSVTGQAGIGPTGVDEIATATLRFANGILAQVACSIAVRQDNVLHVMGTKGRIEVNDFWFAGGKEGGTEVIRVYDDQRRLREYPVSEDRNLYSFQFEATNLAILSGERELTYPAMSWADSLGNAKVLDRWLAEAGMRYD